MNKKTTTHNVSGLASRVLRSKNSSNMQKSLAGSALSQRNSQNETGPQLEDVASKVLRSPKYNEITKQLAASVLSQSNKKR